MLPCLNKTLLGFECPGCGIQRSAIMITKGDFSGAFYMYPAIFTLILLVLFFIFNKYYKFKNDHKVMGGLVILNVVIIITNYIIKLSH
ncbi:DUF2752 domain-containing protein [Mangrovimonas sp. CR14]|nr:DUF2752 domain-containing protein [Mangrovimonas sp. CR14]